MALTVDLAAMDKECSALGGLFQQVVTDMKVSEQIGTWKDGRKGWNTSLTIAGLSLREASFSLYHLRNLQDARRQYGLLNMSVNK